MLPVLDRSQSPEFSEPYRLLAPLVVLSFPSGIALPSVRPRWLDGGARIPRALTTNPPQQDGCSPILLR
jgi:hypothetical protein